MSFRYDRYFDNEANTIDAFNNKNKQEVHHNRNSQ